MGSPTQIDWGGNTLITKNIRVGATKPGQAGTDISAAEISVLDGVTAGTVTASKAVVVDSSKNLTGLGTIDATGVGAGTTAASTTFVKVAAGTTAKSQLNLAASTAPTSPVDGDVWFDGTNLKIRVGGATKTVTIA